MHPLSDFGNISIRGARVNNLKNISVDIPRRKLVLITGVSGSGKSSLAFDTLYAEGQRRYVESLNSYARQFLERMEKPDVDSIQGISPAIAIEQKTGSANPRSTVGTTTEIHELLKLLFARIGKTYSPVSGELVTQDRISDVVDYIISRPEGEKIAILAPVRVRNRNLRKELELALQKGFSRIWQEGEPVEIEDMLNKKSLPDLQQIVILVDRLLLAAVNEPETRFRIADSVQAAYQEGMGECQVVTGSGKPKSFSEKFEKDGIAFEVPSVNMFSFNNSYGACPHCQGYGRVIGIDEDLVVPEKTRSVYSGAVAAWRGERMGKYREQFITEATKFDFPIHRPWFQLTENQKDIVRNGIGKSRGIKGFFETIAAKSQKIQYRVMVSRYRGYSVCSDCKGSRIRPDANHVKVGGFDISTLLMMQIRDVRDVFDKIKFDDRTSKIVERLLREIRGRINYVIDVGVGYLELNRKMGSLSGGELQRIRLATSLGNGLVGAMYILDEPSVGLHPRDTEKLTGILESLRDKGNTVIVVEHDENIIDRADVIIDIGPGAGESGGEIVFAGDLKAMRKSGTLTARYLDGTLAVPLPERRRAKVNSIIVKGAAAHNLKGIDVEFPLNLLTVVTGVSGSGKSTLVREILYPALRVTLEQYGDKPGAYDSLTGDLDEIHFVEMVDQSPIGKSARSNPATYMKAWDFIRELFASQPLSRIRNYQPGHFSFNVDGGRCEICKGDGSVTIEMQFLPDITLKCDACKGKRFKSQILEVNFEGRNADEILKMTIQEAIDFFSGEPRIIQKLRILGEVGLGYLRLGQSSSTLSGGEAQRLKLASFLATASQSSKTVYIFDEPTTGLHFDDIRKLMYSLQALVEKGNTVIVIEHNMEVIKCADWIVDLGPEGGTEGGELLYQGPPEGLANSKRSITGKYLKGKLQVKKRNL